MTLRAIITVPVLERAAVCFHYFNRNMTVTFIGSLARPRTLLIAHISVYKPHIYNKTQTFLQASIRICSAAK